MKDAALVDDNMPPLDIEETQENVEVESNTPEESAPQAVDAPVEPSGAEKRINKVIGERYAEKRRADAAEARIKELEAATKQPEAKAPTLEDYDYDDEAFNNANIAYHVQQSVGNEAKRIQEQALADAQAAKQAAINSTFEERESQYAAQNPAYIGAVSALPMFSEEALNLIKSEGPEMAMALGNNLELAHEIVNASPMEAAMKIGVLSAQLKAAPQVKTSAAPAPIEGINSGGALSKDIGEMSMEDIYNL